MSKIRKQAKELLHSASKVYHYRRDVISEEHLVDLDNAVGEVDRLAKDSKTESDVLEASMNRLDSLLHKIGGKIYPKTFWSDNVEVALVAAILVIGVRTFFFQPFIIPTNSMFPTYSGMNSVVYETPEDAPNQLGKAFRLLTLGARHKELIAENAGSLKIPMAPTAGGGIRPYFEPASAKKWLILNSVVAEYTVYVGDVPHKIKVPADFDMLSLFSQSFSMDKSGIVRDNTSKTGYFMDLGVEVAAGDPILNFDITLGDALFVDRLSYHFVRPDAGDPFVFRTKNIPDIEGGVDKYYIKRIGGVGGETLEINNGTLLVDGEPRDEVEAFGRNARKEGDYKGYINKQLLGEGRKLQIPDGKFVALGDNSGNSLDSRYWGFVPDRSVIGKAIFIYYPFTKRWGVAE